MHPRYPFKNTFEVAIDDLCLREDQAGHRDHRIRGRLLFDIATEAGIRQLDDEQIHTVLRLSDRALRNGKLSTDQIRDALATMRALPNIPERHWPPEARRLLVRCSTMEPA